MKFNMLTDFVKFMNLCSVKKFFLCNMNFSMLNYDFYLVMRTAQLILYDLDFDQ